MSHADHGHGPKVPDVELDQLIKLGYDTRDVALNTLVKWLFFLFVFIGITTAITMGLYRAFIPEMAELERMSPLAVNAEGRRLPPNPQLQVHPKRDMIMYRRAEERVLNGYTYTRSGQVAIPIAEAKEQLAARGIAGVTEGSVPHVERPKSYPGSGQFLPASGEAAEHSAAHPAQNLAPSDQTSAAPASSANAVHDSGHAGEAAGSHEAHGAAEPDTAPNARPGSETAPAPAGAPHSAAPAAPAATPHSAPSHGGAH